MRALYEVRGIPVQSTVLLPTEEDARCFPTGDLELTFCNDCGLAFNATFEPSLVDYSAPSEESQHASGTFNAFAARLVEELAARYDLQGARTLEIGCGKGEFLAALAERTGTSAHGIDPGFIPGRLHEDRTGADLTFDRAYFRPETVGRSPDLIVCRHTLEHIGPVGEFLADVASLVLDQRSDRDPDGHSARASAALFFETPDARRVLEEGAFWDIYYEHASYFTLGSHARLFRAAGLNVTDLRLDYGDQYIIQHATVGGPARELLGEDDLDAMRDLAGRAGERLAHARGVWREAIDSRAAAGRRIALWGGASKATAFLTTNALADEIDTVVDINPMRQGKYLPVSGHRIVAPDVLAERPPDTVLIMNGIYREEIAADLKRMGIEPEILVL